MIDVLFSVIAQTLPQNQPQHQLKIDPPNSRVSSNELKVAQLLANSSAKNLSKSNIISPTTITKRSFVVEMKEKHEKDTLKMKFEKAWNEFLQYLNHEQKPGTQDYLNYFQYLKTGKCKPVALWTTFNRLQQFHHQIYKEDLRSVPELLELSKKLKNPEPQELYYFDLGQIQKFLLISNSQYQDNNYWLCRKAFVVVAHFGQLDCESIKKLKLQDLITDNSTNGIFVKTDSKQFLVPRKPISSSTSLSYAGILLKYKDVVIQDTKQTKGPLFRHFFKASRKFTRIPLGVAVMQKIRCEVAQSLGLADSDKFCEACFWPQEPQKIENLLMH